MYKTSFNGLKVCVNGVYSAYNLTQDELNSLKRTFGEIKVNGSNGNYTVYKDAKRSVMLQLFVHQIWRPVEFDIRKDLLSIFRSNKIYTKNIEELSKKLKELRIQLHVDYDHINDRWYIVDYNDFLELLKNLIAEL